MKWLLFLLSSFVCGSDIKGGRSYVTHYVLIEHKRNDPYLMKYVDRSAGRPRINHSAMICYYCMRFYTENN